jgi:hypothetical protein
MELFRVFGGGLFTISGVWAAGRLVAPRTPLAPEIRFPAGAAAVSLAIFLLLQFHAGYRGVLWTLGGLTIVAGLIARPLFEDPLPRLPRTWRILYWLVYGGFAMYYLVLALAPEIEADAVGYHLGLVSEYVRRHGMPARISFFDLLPQGMEMLFVPAFGIGRHSAAKLVHFAFLLNVVPLIRRAGAVVGIAQPAAACAALLFYLSPVAAVDGTAAYTDVALTCAATASFALLLRWRKGGGDGVLVAAGLNAGFCYAIKPTMGVIPLAGVILILYGSRSPSLAVVFGGIAAVIMLPWVSRSFVLTGNPFAPFLNQWFPNDGISPDTEQNLSYFFGMFSPNFHWKTAFLDYTIRGGHQGMLGLAFLLAPMALLALRKAPGRWLLGYGAITVLTFPVNAGTRFLMPAAGTTALALTSLLPVPASIALVVVQGVGSLRPILTRFNVRHDWMAPPFPLRASLRLEPEDHYLGAWIDYHISQMVKEKTPKDARIFMMGPFSWAYLEREPMVFWHSAEARQISTELNDAHSSPGNTNLRSLAMRRILRAGYSYVLVPTAHDPFEEIGRDMLNRSEEWGIEPVGQSYDSHLFRIIGRGL